MFSTCRLLEKRHFLMYKIVVFDLDGTLVNSIQDLAESVNKGLEKCGLPVHSLEEYRFFVGNGREVLLKKAMGEENYSKPEMAAVVRDTFDEEYAAHSLDNTKPYEGCCELLSRLDELGIKTAVLSNKPDEFVNRLVSVLFPNHSFAAAWGQKKEYKRKPSGEGLCAMLESLGIEKSQCFYVGDSDVDVFTAQNAGVDMCGAEWGFRDKEELKAAGAKYTCKSPIELLDFLVR